MHFYFISTILNTGLLLAMEHFYTVVLQLLKEDVVH